MRNLTQWVRSQFLNTGFFKLVYMYFYYSYWFKAEVAVQRNWAVFYICLIWFGVACGFRVLMVWCFWCTFCKLIGNQGFFLYRRYIFLGIATTLEKRLPIYIPALCNTLYSKNAKYTIYNIDIRYDFSLWTRLYRQMIKKRWKRQKMWNN